jgi:hypothetical protein
MPHHRYHYLQRVIESEHITFKKETMSISIPPLPTREISPSDRAQCRGCNKKIAYGITRVKEDYPHERYPMYYHEGCCSPDTVAALEESEANHPEDIRKKLYFLINPQETDKQQNLAMSVFLNSMQEKLSGCRYALSVFHGGKQEDYIKFKLLKSIAYKLPTSKKELVDAGIDPPVVKQYGDEILKFMASWIKEKEKEYNREDPVLAILRSCTAVGPMVPQLYPQLYPIQPVGPIIAAQDDARLRDERSTKRRKTDDSTEQEQNNEDDASAVAITETLTNDDAVARRVKEAEQNGSVLTVE